MAVPSALCRFLRPWRRAREGWVPCLRRRAGGHGGPRKSLETGGASRAPIGFYSTMPCRHKHGMFMRFSYGFGGRMTCVDALGSMMTVEASALDTVSSVGVIVIVPTCRVYRPVGVSVLQKHIQVRHLDLKACPFLEWLDLPFGPRRGWPQRVAREVNRHPVRLPSLPPCRRPV